MGFFIFSDFCKKHNIPFYEKSCCVCVVGERNCGKTTSPLNEFMERASSTNKILIARLTEKQLKTQIQDFNNRFSGRFQIVGGLIYKLQKTLRPHYKKYDGDPFMFKRVECVGYVADLNNYHNYKSVEAKDVKLIFIDEIIQLDNMQMFYEKLINLFMTFARFNKPSILMIGNRDSVNNEIMVSWEIDPQKEAPTEDVVYNVAENVWYVDLGTEQFKDLYQQEDQDPHIVKTIAKFNPITNSYLNQGGYLVDYSLNVVPYKKKLEATFKPKFLCTFGERLAVFGECLDGKHAIVKHPDAIKAAQDYREDGKQLMTIPLDTQGFLVAESELVEKDVIESYLRTFLLLYKKGELYCDSFEMFDWLKQKMRFFMDLSY